MICMHGSISLIVVTKKVLLFVDPIKWDFDIWKLIILAWLRYINQNHDDFLHRNLGKIIVYSPEVGSDF
jgi:hypothetical protein